jgi:hypothetical protein
VNASLTSVRGILKLDSGLFEKALAGLSREQLVKSIAPGANPALWIAGHLVGGRYSIASMLGGPLSSPLAPVFARGAQVPKEADLPGVEQVLAAWREISPLVLDRLDGASPEQRIAPSPKRLPLEDSSVLGAITFLTYHEGYHFGQLALVRKALGLPGLVDG